MLRLTVTILNRFLTKLPVTNSQTFFCIILGLKQIKELDPTPHRPPKTLFNFLASPFLVQGCSGSFEKHEDIPKN